MSKQPHPTPRYPSPANQQEDLPELVPNMHNFEPLNRSDDPWEILESWRT